MKTVALACHLRACAFLIVGLPLLPGSFAQSPVEVKRPPAWAIPLRPASALLSVPNFDKLHTALVNGKRARVLARLNEASFRSQESNNESEPAGAQVVQGKSRLARQQNNVLSRLSHLGAVRTRKFEHVPFMAAEVDDIDFFVLLNSPEIDLVEEDVAVPPLLSQSVPLIGADGSGTFSGFTGSRTTLAILDTGVDSSHPFLSGKVIEEACYSTTSSYSTSLCPNGEDSQIGPGAGLNCDPSIASCIHGTHVAGIAAGRGQGFNGVAKDATVIAIQVFSLFTPSYCGTSEPCILSYDSDQIAAMERVYALKDTYRIAAVNMSLGGGLSSSYCDSSGTAVKAAIDLLRSAGIATVIAAGNGGASAGISYPSCISSAVSVGATTKSDEVAGYSNSASILNLFAPGSSINSSIPGGYGFMSGTSMAAPHVAGAWAVLKSKKPGATVCDRRIDHR